MFGRRNPQASAQLEALTKENSPAQRAGVARVLGDALNADLSEAERNVAEDIVRILSEDVIESVRKALAQSVASSPHLPRSVAQRLARDIEEVSIPVLELSSVLSDEVLKEVIGKGTPRQVEATAKRSQISEVVSDAIVERGHVLAVSLLVGNEGASLGAETWLKAIERYGEEEQLINAAIDRGRIPEEVAAKLLEISKAHVSSFVTRYLNVPAAAIPATDELKIEVGTKHLVAPLVPTGVKPNRYAETLHKRCQLSRQVLLHALCAGEFIFLAAALAHLTELPFHDVQLKLLFTSEHSRKQVLERAGLEPAMLSVFESLLSKGDIIDRVQYQRQALEMVSTALGQDFLPPTLPEHGDGQELSEV